MVTEHYFKNGKLDTELTTYALGQYITKKEEVKLAEVPFPLLYQCLKSFTEDIAASGEYTTTAIELTYNYKVIWKTGVYRMEYCFKSIHQYQAFTNYYNTTLRNNKINNLLA